MSARTVLLIVVGSLAGVLPGYARLPVNNQTPPQTPSDVARFLADHGAVVQLPLKGKVKHSIKKGDPTFAVAEGTSSVLLLRLPEYQAPYAMTITSYRRGIGRTTEIFVPIGLCLDAAFQQVGEFGEERLAGKVESLVAELTIGEADRNVRYLFLYTRGDLVHQRVNMQAVINGVPIAGKAGTFIGSGFGLGRVERSLEAKREVQTTPEKRPK